MRQLTIYLCEDIRQHSEMLSEICTNLSADYPHKLEVFSTAESLMKQLEILQGSGKAPDLVMLDIELGETDGITLGKQIREIFPDVFLVFVTAYIEYAVKGYEASAFRYLLKPVSEEGLRTLFSDIHKELKKQKKVSIKTPEGETVVSLKDLLYISAEDKYTVLYTKTQHFVSDHSLKYYEEMLSGLGFFRIHRKYLVNMYHHKGINGGSVVLSQQSQLPISKKKAAEYRKQLFLYLGEDMV